MWPGTARAISMWPTGTETRALRSSIPMGDSSSRGAAREVGTASSICRSRSPWMHATIFTWRTGETSESRYSIRMATSCARLETWGRRGPSASRRARTNSCSVPIPTTLTTWTTAKSTSSSLTASLLGKFGRAGKQPKEFGTVNQMDCRNPNELYVGEVLNWRVQRLTLR